ncbi:hypothetical protein GGR56DRAFT_28908 [Xylariaceae sp. FL0804]|nr:hypothetical protein GGR56DRAFT_28908 [Xylariaceae sp. FL0804]
MQSVLFFVYLAPSPTIATKYVVSHENFLNAREDTGTGTMGCTDAEPKPTISSNSPDPLPYRKHGYSILATEIRSVHRKLRRLVQRHHALEVHCCSAIDTRSQVVENHTMEVDILASSQSLRLSSLRDPSQW